jgi:hypothetical protein
MGPALALIEQGLLRPEIVTSQVVSWDDAAAALGDLRRKTVVTQCLSVDLTRLAIELLDGLPANRTLDSSRRRRPLPPRGAQGIPRTDAPARTPLRRASRRRRHRPARRVDPHRTP